MGLGAADLLQVPLSRRLLAQQALLDFGEGLHVAPEQKDRVTVSGLMQRVANREFPPGIVHVVQFQRSHGRFGPCTQRRDPLRELGFAFLGQEIREDKPDPVIEAAQGRTVGTDRYPDDDTGGIDRNGHVGRLFDKVIDVLWLGQDTGKKSLG